MSCGATLGIGAMFCGECGARVVGGTSASQPTVPVSAIISTVPPGLVPERPVAPLPPAVVITAPPPASVAPAPAENAVDEDLDATIMSPRRGGSPWSIVTPDGTWLAIREPSVIGRAPRIPEGRAGLVLLPLIDDTKSLSKTHAVLTPDGDTFTVEDLGSTNGVIITTREGAVVDALPGVVTPLSVGSVLELGDFLLVVERS